MNKRFLAILLFVISFYPFGVMANDSEATIAAGGLELVNNKDISIESEDLYISEDIIKVNYIFKNNSDKDIKTLVAFPLAPILEIAEDEYDGNVEVNADNPVNFYVTVNKKPVKFKIERKKNKDNSINIKYYWEQTFPANKFTKVFHRYQPVMGGWFVCEPREDDSCETDLTKFNNEYCVSKDLGKWMKKTWASRSNGEYSSLLMLKNIVYILKTANNWSGPIKDFKLKIEKPSKNAKLSYCFPGSVDKNSPTTYEIKRKNFVPEKDLDIVILE
ncbi:MAG: hypothetical protein COS89_02650 [Deltaproteobacteria bacterium CG07_land_8_20_14_0_80_38_7]|nr:MAG: hypothetical protein COS89_02650 [Deltaproteobacteria bacterium CG07_land_8_20_14_0_80_38_7]